MSTAEPHGRGRRRAQPRLGSAVALAGAAAVGAALGCTFVDTSRVLTFACADAPGCTAGHDDAGASPDSGNTPDAGSADGGAPADAGCAAATGDGGAPGCPGRWRDAASLQLARQGHVAVSLSGGDALVLGGQADDGVTILTSTERYDAARDAWRYVAPMPERRVSFGFAFLADAGLLVAGGQASNLPTSSATLYEPDRDTWTPQAPMGTVRSSFCMVLLHDGRVLAAGGSNLDASALPTAELFDPTTGRWTPTTRLTTPRVAHAATRLGDGRVLVVGGKGETAFTQLSSAEVYEPAADRWSTVAPMRAARSHATAITLADGRALVVGGYVGSDLSSFAELYDPRSDAWVSTGPASILRDLPAVAILSDGRVIVAGGYVWDGAGPSVLRTAELFDPALNAWSAADAMSAPRIGMSLTTLESGLVLVAGGSSAYFGARGLASTAIYTPPP